MNRLIKFRVWHHSSKSFLTSRGEEYGEMNNYHYNLGLYYDLSEILCDDRRFTVQQWTGLFDSEGVEIYEGDLITSSKRLILVEYQAPEYVFRYKHYFDDNDWVWLFHDWGYFRGVVSGNILENKDIYEKNFKPH
jgi:hypothetical protein